MCMVFRLGCSIFRFVGVSNAKNCIKIEICRVVCVFNRKYGFRLVSMNMCACVCMFDCSICAVDDMIVGMIKHGRYRGRKFVSIHGNRWLRLHLYVVFLNHRFVHMHDFGFVSAYRGANV